MLNKNNIINELILLSTVGVVLSFGQFNGYSSPDVTIRPVLADTSDFPITPGFTTRGIASGSDLDQDGLKEIIITDYKVHGVHIYEVTGDDVIEWVATLGDDTPTYASTPRHCITTDLDGNGRDEIIFIQYGYTAEAPNAGIHVWEWDGVIGSDNYTHHLLPLLIDGNQPDRYYAQRNLFSGDVDGDGVVELLISNNGSAAASDIFVIGSVNGTFESGFYALEVEYALSKDQGAFAGSPFGQPNITDLDGDGKNEAVFFAWDNATVLLIESFGEDLYLLQSVTMLDSTFHDATVYGTTHVTDIDSDGHDEIYGNTYSQKNWLWQITGGDDVSSMGYETGKINILVDSLEIWDVTGGDIDDDGIDEIFTIEWDSASVKQWKYSGSGWDMSVIAKWPDQMGGFSLDFAGDLDNDGKPELLQGFLADPYSAENPNGYSFAIIEWENEYESPTVQFIVNMNHQINLEKFNPDSDFVDIAGSFNDWAGGSVLSDTVGDGLYRGLFNIDTGTIQYKYRINGSWDVGSFESDPNRFYTVKEGTNILPTVWYNREEPDKWVSLSIDSVQCYGGDTLNIPMKVSISPDSKIFSTRLTLEGFQDEMQFLNLVPDSSLIGTGNWTTEFNLSPDSLVLAMAGAEAIIDSGILCHLQFAVPLDSDTGFVPINISSALFDTGVLPVSILNGGVRIIEKSVITPIELELPHLVCTQGDTLAIPVRVYFPPDSLYDSAELTIGGYQEGLAFIGIDTTGSILGGRDWLLSWNEVGDTLYTVLAGSEDISTVGLLFNLEFIADGTPCESHPIEVIDALFNTDTSVSITNGSVDILLPPTYVGDIEDNGSVSHKDIYKYFDYLVNEEELGCQAYSNADVTGDLSVSALDAWGVYQKVFGSGNLPVDTSTTDLDATGTIYFSNYLHVSPNRIHIPIFVQDGDNILSYQGSVVFDSLYLKPYSGGIAGDLWTESMVYGDHINIAGIRIEDMVVEGPISTLSFEIINPAFDLSQIRLVNWQLNEIDAIWDTLNVVDTDQALNYPQLTYLHPNFPNPFNPTTTIPYEISEKGNVTMTVYDIKGREMQVLKNERQQPGLYEIQWNGLNEVGTPVGSGIYLLKLETNQYSEVRKMILLR